MSKKKKAKKYDKTFRRTLEAIVPKPKVKKKDRPKKVLKGWDLVNYTLWSMVCAGIIGTTAVLARAHVDYLGGHRDKSVMDQIKCVIENPPHLWKSDSKPICPIRESDWS